MFATLTLSLSRRRVRGLDRVSAVTESPLPRERERDRVRVYQPAEHLKGTFPPP
jgi:hypothetical protein